MGIVLCLVISPWPLAAQGLSTAAKDAGERSTPEDGAFRQVPIRYFRRSLKARGPVSQRDPVIQSSAPTRNIPSPTLSFDGNSNADGFIPPDTNGDVGPSNYVQVVNVRVQVFDKF